jgi:hypothetical protein
LSEDELKRIFLKPHPKTWINRFGNAGKTASMTLMGEIKKYMEHQAKKEPIASSTRPKMNNVGSNNNSNIQTIPAKATNKDKMNVLIINWATLALFQDMLTYLGQLQC